MDFLELGAVDKVVGGVTAVVLGKLIDKKRLFHHNTVKDYLFIFYSVLKGRFMEFSLNSLYTNHFTCKS
jgi:hypothetical protein